MAIKTVLVKNPNTKREAPLRTYLDLTVGDTVVYETGFKGNMAVGTVTELDTGEETELWIVAKLDLAYHNARKLYRHSKAMRIARKAAK